ncbi:MAG: YggS family pyridoxal phosphate-dependent enzyme [Rikenellaceae bacterium]
MSISQNLDAIRQTLPKGVELIVVSKYQPVEKLQEAYDCGERVFGESRPQELVKKYESLPKDIKWNMIGALQTNKVKYIAPFIGLIHSGTSSKLFEVIDKEAKKCDRVVDVLFEIHVAQEESKHGWEKSELLEYLANGGHQTLNNIRFRGVMAMASFTYDTSLVKREFKHAKELFDEIKQNFFADKNYFDTISMGMSGDYKLAIEKGATMVRIGTSIFR